MPPVDLFIYSLPTAPSGITMGEGGREGLHTQKYLTAGKSKNIRTRKREEENASKKQQIANDS